MKNMTRRQAIGAAMGATVGGALGVLIPTKLTSAAQAAPVEVKKSETPVKIEWKPVTLDAAKVAPEAYKLYAEGNCMYASFTSLCRALAEASEKTNPSMSKVLKEFPCEMMKYGHSGTGNQGSLCGALNGCSAIFGLLVRDKKKVDSMIAELFGYYETTEMPIFKPEPENPKFEPMAQSVANSVLCHVSQMNWCKESGESPFSEFRSDRCKRLTADCVTKAIEILNRYVESEGKAIFKTSNTQQKACMDCHGENGAIGNVSARMDCTTCHDMVDHYEE